MRLPMPGIMSEENGKVCVPTVVIVPTVAVHVAIPDMTIPIFGPITRLPKESP
jgi:hypothetical protein